ncbi:MAG: hypothetical protein KF891_23930, partial [Rhizobacter sp.]|nr:hypothetical protein [Rhizobacter sp.]
MQREPLSDAELMLADAPQGEPAHGGALATLLAERPAALSRSPLPEVVVGELVAIVDDGDTPLVLYPGQPGTAALRARTVLDLHGAHIGRQVVLSFE